VIVGMVQVCLRRGSFSGAHCLVSHDDGDRGDGSSGGGVGDDGCGSIILNVL
jgi:hypothetical protein